MFCLWFCWDIEFVATLVHIMVKYSLVDKVQLRFLRNSDLCPQTLYQKRFGRVVIAKVLVK